MKKLLISIVLAWIGLVASGGVDAQVQTRDASGLRAKNIPYHIYSRELGGFGKLLRNMSPEWESYLTQELQLDFYAPPQESTIWPPLIIFCHRGNSFLDNKEESAAQYFAQRMVKKGFAVAVIDYRHAAFGLQQGIDPYYLAAQDLNAAAHFLVKNRSRFHFNAKAIIFAGEGMGAVTALHAAFWDPHEVKGANTQALDEAYGSIRNDAPDLEPIEPIAVINIGGGVLDTTILNDEQTPVFSIQGTLDTRIRFRHGIPSSWVSNSVDIYWKSAKDFLSLSKDPALLRERFPLYGSELIHMQLAMRNIPNQLVPLYGEKSNLIMSADGLRPRTTTRVIFEYTDRFLFPKLIDSVFIKGDTTAVMGSIVTYTASIATAAQYEWSKGEGGTFVGDSTGHSVKIAWKQLSPENQVSLKMRNRMGFWSPETTLPVKISLPVETSPTLSRTITWLMPFAIGCCITAIIFVWRKK